MYSQEIDTTIRKIEVFQLNNEKKYEGYIIKQDSDLIQIQTKEGELILLEKKELKKEQDNDSSIVYPWQNTLFIASGYGYPQGLRCELGYNLWQYFSVGLIFGIFEHWTKDPLEGTVGYLIRLNIPFKGSKNGLYLIFCHGGESSIGTPYRYYLIDAGMLYPLYDWIVLRGEMGMLVLSKCVSGCGLQWHGSNVQTRYTKIYRFGIQFGFEIAFARLL